MKWFVVYTKSNFELNVSERINTYCPTFTQIKYYSDCKKKVQKTLLTTYALVQLSEQDRLKVFAIPRMVRYLFWLVKPALVNEEEIILLKKKQNTFLQILNLC